MHPVSLFLFHTHTHTHTHARHVCTSTCSTEMSRALTLTHSHTAQLYVIALFVDNRYNVDEFVVRTGVVRERLMQSLSANLRTQAELFAFTPDNLRVLASGNDGTLHTLPRLTVPEPHCTSGMSFDLEACKRRAEGNLDSRQLPCAPGASSPEDLLAWLQRARSDTLDLSVAAVEEWVLATAIRHLNEQSSPVDASATPAYVVALDKLAQAYRGLVEKLYKSTEASAGRLRVEIWSRETLTVWAIACLADCIVAKEFPDLKQFQMALDYRSLSVLSLSDGLSHDALAAVTLYVVLSPLFC